MVNHPSPIRFALLALVAAALACGPLPVGTSEPLSPDQQTQQALGATAMAQTAAAPPEAAPTEPPPATEPPPEPTAEPTATVEIVHNQIPTNPGSVSSFITDRSTRSLASERRALADNFDVLLFERPYTTEVMDYQAHIDITRTELSSSGAWFYVTLFLEAAAPAGATPRYGVEIDIDKDGRGDWLIWGLSPSGTDWTTDGVQALRDADNNVGGATPIQSETPPQTGNGYEDLVFNAGVGADPDSAWIRWSPSSPSHVELAFKQTLIGPPGEFMWGAWADEGPQDPARFDYNDAFDLASAGSPVSTTSYYPLKQLAQIDNTCRWGYGFTPIGNEPGVCYVPPTPTPEPTGSISGSVYRGTSGSPTSDGFGGVTVTLGQGSCSSSGYKSTTTSGGGSYSFNGLPAGSYCVTVKKSSLPPAPYGWGTMYPGGFGGGGDPYQSVTIGPNESKGGVNFAFLEIVG